MTSNQGDSSQSCPNSSTNCQPSIQIYGPKSDIPVQTTLVQQMDTSNMWTLTISNQLRSELIQLEDVVSNVESIAGYLMRNPHTMNPYKSSVLTAWWG